MQSALGLATSTIAEPAPGFPNGAAATRSGPGPWQRTIPILANGAARPTSSHSTTPCSVSFEDEDAVRDLASSTPITGSLSDPSSTSPPDGTHDGWGFEEDTAVAHAPAVKPPVVVPAESFEDFGAGLLDEQHAAVEASMVQAEAKLQAPIEPTKPMSGGKKRKGRNGKSPALGRSPA
jgi:hypothetical protein